MTSSRAARRPSLSGDFSGTVLKRPNDDSVSLFAKDTLLRELAWNPQDLDVRQRPDAILLFTGAKAYPHGNGWWTISGYANDRSDVNQVLDRVNDLLSNHSHVIH